MEWYDKAIRSNSNMILFILIVFCASQGLGMPDRMQQNKYIIGGQKTNISEVPYTAVVFANGRFVCGATIIGKNHLLTAAHCIMPNLSQTVRVGSSYREKGGVIHKVKNAVKHPLYSTLKYDYDAGCLETEDPIEFNSNVQPIPITDVEPKGGETALVSGYGRNSTSSLPDQLQSAKITVLDREKCKESHSNITPRMICTFDKCQDRCTYKGDSGGPIVVNGKVVGAVSWGSASPCLKPTVYTNFNNPEIRQFIRDVTGH